ncbi:MAG: ABC transporter ATP-binding protein [Nostoc sp. DedQUE08]|uniref:ABC transporter ATP-binding protein n=1 Tax=Nostoc sp. DedQUE08 TaxID=3075393 RepID=UPI002AD53A6D|nr:ABC transporter ATP-binding protein [Nostoc sp. DedQUE08]MDZ8064307.1 ABC transporter ATP-binding protein [Nostoc sp. DedQUE08]
MTRREVNLQVRQEIELIMHRYGQMLRYPLRQWRTLIAILGLTAGTCATATLQPWPMKILVDYAFGQAVIPPPVRSFLGTFNLALTPALLVVVAAVCSLGLYALNATLETSLSWAWSAAGQGMVYELAQRLFYRLQRLSLLFHSQRTVGDSLSRLAGDTYCVYTLSGALLISPVQYLLTLATISLVAWNLSPLLTLLSLFVAPIMGCSALVFGSRLKRRTKLNREAQSRLTSFVHQTVTAIPMIQAFGRESYNTQQFEHLAADAVVLSQRETLLKSVYGVANGTVTTIGTAIVLYVGGQQVLLGAMSIGSLLVFLAYLQSIQGAFKGLFGIYGSLKSVDANIDRVLEVLDAEDGVQDAPGARPLPARPTEGRGHVCLEKVSFGYEPNYPVLKEITLEARSGETIALVGATGAGKSTLVSLIPRFFDPWQGRVLFDGVDVRDVQLKSLRERIALVLQEPFLLPLSVAQNIAYGCPEASLEKIVAAAKAAKADDFIQQLPQGYDTPIGERGALLSGGQRQRIAIARALLKDAPVLILDEPTSALDAQTENLLLEALDRLIEGRTTFIIAHRLSTIQRADRIVVLEQGKVVEMGTHQELLAIGGFYQRLHSLQFSKPPQEAVL